MTNLVLPDDLTVHNLHTLATKIQNMPKLAIHWASILPQVTPLHLILVKYWDWM